MGRALPIQALLPYTFEAQDYFLHLLSLISGPGYLRLSLPLIAAALYAIHGIFYFLTSFSSCLMGMLRPEDHPQFPPVPALGAWGALLAPNVAHAGGTPLLFPALWVSEVLQQFTPPPPVTCSRV